MATTEARVHDLPPRWDGFPVVWGEWTDEIPSTYRLHAEDLGACGRCGSLAPMEHSRGTVDVPDRRPLALFVTRCTDCRHDVVLDADDVAWDLEPADYTDGGSERPAGPPPAPRRFPPRRPAPPPPAPRPTGRPLPADSTPCGRCGARIVWAITVAGPNGRGGKSQPLDPHEHPDGNVAVSSPRRGRLLARALMADEQHDPHTEFLAMPHAATCRRTT
ncbi:hypothetical protein ACOACO_17560 [Nocardioides sp. CPCC 205120]|uniref:hypothetical protein n=1 Tax=Nocardioides sp. CPCC 205120 TaxID=3406462 RepID=UPI003B50EEFE